MPLWLRIAYAALLCVLGFVMAFWDAYRAWTGTFCEGVDLALDVLTKP